MSILGKLFGTDSAVEKTIETAGSLLDNAFYTEQEKAGDRSEARREVHSMVIKWMEATTGSRLARRILAIAITFTWLSLFIIGTAFSLIGVFLNEVQASLMMQASALLDGRSETMTPAVMLILGFYFAAPYMGDLAKGALEKFGNGNSNKS